MKGDLLIESAVLLSNLWKIREASFPKLNTKILEKMLSNKSFFVVCSIYFLFRGSRLKTGYNTEGKN